MKQRITLLTMFLLAMTMRVFAANDYVKIGGDKMSNGTTWTSGHKINGGSASLSSDGKTLTLRNILIESGNNDGIEPGRSGLTINLVGDNVMNMSSDRNAFEIFENVTISGSGTLTINMKNTNQRAFYLRDDVELVIRSKVTVNGGIGFVGDGANKKSRALIYDGANVTLKCGRACIQNLGQLWTASGTLTMTPGSGYWTARGLGKHVFIDASEISSPSNISMTTCRDKSDNKDYNTYILVVSGSTLTGYSGTIKVTPTAIAINSTNFPDMMFRSFVKSQYDKSKNFNYVNARDYSDANFGYEYLSNNERAGVTTIDINGTKRIASTGSAPEDFPTAYYQNLKGIEYFENLEELFCDYNYISSLDVSKNKKLKKIRLWCNNLKGDAMQKFVNSLPTVTSGQGMLYVYSEDEGKYEHNIITPAQVNIAKNRNWRVVYRVGSNIINDYDGQKEKPSLYYSQTEMTTVCGVTQLPSTPRLNNPNNVPVTYSSSNTSVATVNSSTGNLTSVVGAGETIIKATFVGNSNYEATSTQFKLIVIKGTPTLSFAQSKVTTTYGATLMPATPKLNNPQNVPVTYSSSNTSVATVNSSSGAITSVVGAGETKITASFAGNTNYKPASAQYTLLVEKYTPKVTAPVLNGTAYYGGDITKSLTPATTTAGTLEYSLDGKTYSKSVPTMKDAGVYTLYYRVKGDKNTEDVAAKTVKVTISKAMPTVTAPKAIDGLHYNGSEQVLITAGKTTGGEMQYSLDNKTWSKNLPTGKDAGTYTVYYKVVGNKNYEDVAAKQVVPSIIKAEPVVTAPKAIAGLTANGSAQPLVTAGKTTGGTLQYALDGLTWSTAIPKATEAGQYEVSYKVVPDKNYIGTSVQKVKVTIAKATNTGLKFSTTAVEVVSGESFTAPKLDNPKGLAVTYSSSDKGVATVDAKTGAVTIVGAGTAVITAKFAGDGTYDATEVSYTITVAKKVPEVTAPKAVTGLTANGTAQQLITAGKTTGGEMQYSLNGSTYSTAIPTATDAGTYTVYYKVVGDKQYEDVAVKTVIVTVAMPDAIIITARSYEREYGDANPVFEYEVAGGELDGQPEITCGATKVSDVGDYPITVSQGTVKNLNVTYVPGVLTVTFAPLTATVDSYERKEGEPNPEFTVTYTGWKLPSDETSIIRAVPAFGCEADETSPAGEYPIMMAGGGVKNYMLTIVQGILTVTPATGIDEVLAAGETFDVYTTGGQPVRLKTTTLKGLPKGVYVIVTAAGSRKVAVNGKQ